MIIKNKYLLYINEINKIKYKNNNFHYNYVYYCNCNTKLFLFISNIFYKEKNNKNRKKIKKML